MDQLFLITLNHDKADGKSSAPVSAGPGLGSLNKNGLQNSRRIEGGGGGGWCYAGNVPELETFNGSSRHAGSLEAHLRQHLRAPSGRYRGRTLSSKGAQRLPHSPLLINCLLKGEKMKLNKAARERVALLSGSSSIFEGSKMPLRGINV